MELLRILLLKMTPLKWRLDSNSNSTCIHSKNIEKPFTLNRKKKLGILKWVCLLQMNIKQLDMIVKDNFLDKQFWIVNLNHLCLSKISILNKILSKQCATSRIQKLLLVKQCRYKKKALTTTQALVIYFINLEDKQASKDYSDSVLVL